LRTVPCRRFAEPPARFAAAGPTHRARGAARTNRRRSCATTASACSDHASASRTTPQSDPTSRFWHWRRRLRCLQVRAARRSLLPWSCSPRRRIWCARRATTDRRWSWSPGYRGVRELVTQRLRGRRMLRNAAWRLHRRRRARVEHV